MLEDHVRIEKLLNTAVGGFGLSKEEAIGLFDTFRAALFAHMESEEAMIFGRTDLGDKRIQTMIRKLCDEHGMMRAMIESARASLEKEAKPDIVAFMSLLKSHHALENGTLYPELERLLDPEKYLQTQKDVCLKMLANRGDFVPVISPMIGIIAIPSALGCPVQWWEDDLPAVRPAISSP